MCRRWKSPIGPTAYWAIEALKHGFFGGAWGDAIADAVKLAGPAVELARQQRLLFMAKRQHQGIHAFADDGFPAGHMLQIDRVAVGAVQAGIGNDLHPQLVQRPVPLIAHILLDALAGYITIDRKAHAAAGARQLL